MKVTGNAGSLVIPAGKSVSRARTQIQEKSEPVKGDSLEISDTTKAFDKLEKFLNLGNPDRLDLSGLNPAEKKEFMQMLSASVKRGVVGYEVLEINGRPEKHFVENQIGDARTARAKLYKKRNYYTDPGRTKP